MQLKLVLEENTNNFIILFVSFCSVMYCNLTCSEGAADPRRTKVINILARKKFCTGLLAYIQPVAYRGEGRDIPPPLGTLPPGDLGFLDGKNCK